MNKLILNYDTIKYDRAAHFKSIIWTPASVRSKMMSQAVLSLETNGHVLGTE
jgi:hypothetical protein